MGDFPTVLIILVSIVVFFLLREVFAWYYKTNQMLDKQEEQTELLRKIHNELKKRDQA